MEFSQEATLVGVTLKSEIAIFRSAVDANVISVGIIGGSERRPSDRQMRIPLESACKGKLPLGQQTVAGAPEDKRNLIVACDA